MNVIFLSLVLCVALVSTAAFSPATRLGTASRGTSAIYAKRRSKAVSQAVVPSLGVNVATPISLTANAPNVPLEQAPRKRMMDSPDSRLVVNSGGTREEEITAPSNSDIAGAFTFDRKGGLRQNKKEVLGAAIQDLAVTASMSEDLSDFERRALLQAEQRKLDSQPGQDSGIMKTIKDLIGKALIADFFLVLVFLAWFLAAAATKSSNPFLLEKFQDIFQPVVVPSLTVLMVGSIASGTFGKEEDPTKDRRNY